MRDHKAGFSSITRLCENLKSVEIGTRVAHGFHIIFGTLFDYAIHPIIVYDDLLVLLLTILPSILSTDERDGILVREYDVVIKVCIYLIHPTRRTTHMLLLSLFYSI